MEGSLSSYLATSGHSFLLSVSSPVGVILKLSSDPAPPLLLMSLWCLLLLQKKGSQSLKHPWRSSLSFGPHWLGYFHVLYFLPLEPFCGWWFTVHRPAVHWYTSRLLLCQMPSSVSLEARTFSSGFSTSYWKAIAVGFWWEVGSISLWTWSGVDMALWTQESWLKMALAPFTSAATYGCSCLKWSLWAWNHLWPSLCFSLLISKMKVFE